MRESLVTEPRFTYGVAEMAADGATGDFEIAVAQISDRFGTGPFERIQIDG